jgi:hypothetical protein
MRHEMLCAQAVCRVHLKGTSENLPCAEIADLLRCRQGSLANGWAGSPALVRATPPAHSKRQVFQTETFLVLSRVDLRTKGFQPSCAQNRLAKNQNCIRLGHGRFSEVP